MYSRLVGLSYFLEGVFAVEGENVGQGHLLSASTVTVITVSINRILCPNLEGIMKKVLQEIDMD